MNLLRKTSSRCSLYLSTNVLELWTFNWVNLSTLLFGLFAWVLSFIHNRFAFTRRKMARMPLQNRLRVLASLSLTHSQFQQGRAGKVFCRSCSISRAIKKKRDAIIIENNPFQLISSVSIKIWIRFERYLAEKFGFCLSYFVSQSINTSICASILLGNTNQQ